MDYVSYFIENKAIFGGFPSQETVYELEKNGVRYFVNLTHKNEKKTTPYITKYKVISYPITDQQTPKDWKSFSVFLIKLASIINNLKQGELIYVHCKGGHGRSGVVVASLLCLIYEMSPEDALKKTSLCHSKRSIYILMILVKIFIVLGFQIVHSIKFIFQILEFFLPQKTQYKHSKIP